jgi:hypothetical protein
MHEITYTQVGDYLLPNITVGDVPAGEKGTPLGVYARMHKVWLKEHKPALYGQLLMSGKLFPLLREVDESARERIANGAEIDCVLRELVYA